MFRSPFLCKTLPFIGKTQEGKEWGDKGNKCSPYLHQQAADLRLGPRIRSPDVANWPHPGGATVSVDLAPLCLVGFTIAAPRFDETIFDLLASTARFGRIHSTGFQPLWYAKICPDSLISNLFRIKWAFGLDSLAHPLAMGLHFIKKNRTY